MLLKWLENWQAGEVLSQEYTEWCNQLDLLLLWGIKKGKNKFHTVFKLETIFWAVCLTLKGVYTWNTCNYRVRELFLQRFFFFELLLFDTLIDRDVWKRLMSQLIPPADVLRSCVWHVMAVMRLIERQPEASGCDVPPPRSNELTSKHQQRPVCGSSCWRSRSQQQKDQWGAWYDMSSRTPAGGTVRF